MFAYCNNNPVMYVDETGYALKHNTVLVNDGGGGNSYFNDVSSTDDQTIAVFYEYDHSAQFGSHTIEFDYMYQVQNGKIINAEINRYEVTEIPPFYTAQIIANDVKIVDSKLSDGAIMFSFKIRYTDF